MNCRDAMERMDARLDGELADGRDLDAHVAACATCAAELESRRAFSEQLRREFDDALAEVAPAPGEKEACTRRLAEASTRRLTFLTRLAAVVAIGVSVGLIAYAFGLFGGPSPAEREAAAISVSREQALLKWLESRREALLRDVRDLDHRLPRNHGTQHFGQVVGPFLGRVESAVAGEPIPIDLSADPETDVLAIVQAAESGDPRRRAGAWFALRQLDRAHAPFLLRMQPKLDGVEYHLFQAAAQNLAGVIFVPDEQPSLEIHQDDGRHALRLRQYPNATIELEIDGAQIVAADMEQLLQSHPDVCRDFQISGQDGEVRVGSAVSKAIAIRPSVLRMTRRYFLSEDDDWLEVVPDADRAFTVVVTSRLGDESRAMDLVREVEMSTRRIVRPRDREAALADAQKLLDRTLDSVRRLNARELERVRLDAERRAADLERRLEELETLQTQVDAIKIYLDRIQTLPEK